MPKVSQCFVCREWSWDVSESIHGTHLCLPCYVDVLEVRQERGGLVKAEPVYDVANVYLGPGPDKPVADPPFQFTLPLGCDHTGHRFSCMACGMGKGPALDWEH